MAKRPRGGTTSKPKPSGSAPGKDVNAIATHRHNRQRGFMVAFSFSHDAEAECARTYKQDNRIIKLLTVQEILDEENMQKI